jgi:hypothetical protein
MAQLSTHACFMLCPGLFLRSSDHVVAYTNDGGHIVNQWQSSSAAFWGLEILAQISLWSFLQDPFWHSLDWCYGGFVGVLEVGRERSLTQ